MKRTLKKHRTLQILVKNKFAPDEWTYNRDNPGGTASDDYYFDGSDVVVRKLQKVSHNFVFELLVFQYNDTKAEKVQKEMDALKKALTDNYTIENIEFVVKYYNEKGARI